MANFFDNVGQKARGFTQTTKLNGELSKLQQQRQQMFAQLGQMYYEHRKAEDQPEPDYTQMIAAIDNVTANTRAVEEQIAALKGGTVCQKCSGIVPQGNRFCPHCGAEMPVITPQAAQPFGQPPYGQPPQGEAPFDKPQQGMGMTPPVITPPQGMTCVNCGSPLSPGVKFCAKCGTPTGAGNAPAAPAAPETPEAPTETVSGEGDGNDTESTSES